MGKQKKGSRARSKQQQKQKVQLRRERRLHSAGSDSTGGNLLMPHELTNDLLEGDQVMLRNRPPVEIDSSYRRGRIVEVHETTDEGCRNYSFVPFNRPDKPEFRSRVSSKDLLIDDYPLVHRFNVGEEVIIWTRTGWLAAVVLLARPGHFYNRERDSVPAYVVQTCRKGDLIVAKDRRVVERDEDAYIRRLLPSFRLSRGDRVVLSLAKATTLQGHPFLPSAANLGWVQGTILEVDRHLDGAVYLCDFQHQGFKTRYKCLITQDTDEHIASAAAAPRARLFDAIAQGCRFEHLDWLVQCTGLSIESFRNDVLDAAVHAANYDALLWLQERYSVDLAEVPSLCGGGLLHRISSTPHPERFFLRAGEKMNDIPRIHFGHAAQKKSGVVSLLRRDRLGFTFVRELFTHAKSRAMAVILLDNVLPMKMIEPLSRHRDFGGEFFFFTSFRRKCALYRLLMLAQSRSCTREAFESEVQSTAKIFGDDDLKIVPKRFVNFLWRSKETTFTKFLFHCASDGKLFVIQWLDQYLCHAGNVTPGKDGDMGEYGQLEMIEHRQNELHGMCYYFDIISAAAGSCNQDVHRQKIFGVTPETRLEMEFAVGGNEAYSEHLRMLEVENDSFAFVSILEAELKTKRALNQRDRYALRRKISLLKDDETLSSRLTILDYLVKEKSYQPPSALDVIRWRQCGVLRWLVQGSFVNLDEAACTSEHLLSHVGHPPEILHGTTIKKLPKTVTVAMFLLYVCLECDDLQTLLWLLDCSASLPSNPVLLGFTPIDACAYFGRTEIFLSLVAKERTFGLNRCCSQKKWRGHYPLHIAVSRGYTDLAAHLILQGCPTSTSSGLSVFRLAAKSQYLHVQEWGAAIRSGKMPVQICLDSQDQSILPVVDYGASFFCVWGMAINLLAENKMGTSCISWSKLKSEKLDRASIPEVDEDLANITKVSTQLEETLVATLVENGKVAENLETSSGEESLSIQGDCVGLDAKISSEAVPLQKRATRATDCISLHQLDKIQMTKEVVKLLRVCDNKYREFFLRRLRQLASGDRSRILVKRLVGCKTCIFETYLEQKSGFRILWTPVRKKQIRIWYVAKHDDVSRHIRLIDDCKQRSARRLVSASELYDDVNDSEMSDADSGIMLDLFGNTPLKLHQVAISNMNQLLDTSWTPPLLLTREEQDIVETKGTVLVLGRSGTGKTVCIGNRMDYDWRMYGSDPTFTQIFVARSARLCNLVKETVCGFRGSSTSPGQTFCTFMELVTVLEKQLVAPQDSRRVQQKAFSLPRKMTYQRFKAEVYRYPYEGSTKSAPTLSALTVWKNIRVFLKGSVAALSSQAGLSKPDYLALGSKQCRLSREQREEVYSVYDRYQNYVSANSLWDDCDRIRDLVKTLQETFANDPDCWERIRKNKVYVDEVQDYTQVEILLFFTLSGPDGLFLVGDPTQSVAEGADFRFKDVRAVGHFLSVGGEHRDLIPDKPKTVNLNFRSHTGILTVASAVLEFLFTVFPNSIEHKKKDRGLFQGPRPGIFSEVAFQQLYELSSKVDGVVFITHDNLVAELRQLLNGYPLVFGIREAKGLEFQSVVLVNFFCGLPEGYQKPWRDMLLGRKLASIRQDFPELEGHLKLLYTGLTRSMNRLWFAETKSSLAGKAAMRWLTTDLMNQWQEKGSVRKEGYHSILAIKQRVDDIESMTRTVDEWIATGLDNAIMAEDDDTDPEECIGWLGKALFCFEKANATTLCRKAKAHMESFEFLCTWQHRSKQERDQDFFEVQVAARLCKLLEEGLVLAARRLTFAILPLLPPASRKRIEKTFVQHYPTIDEVFGIEA